MPCGRGFTHERLPTEFQLNKIGLNFPRSSLRRRMILGKAFPRSHRKNEAALTLFQTVPLPKAASWRAAQMSLPIAIAITGMAATERGRRAIEELIADAAMVGAIGLVTINVVTAMVAEPRRKRQWVLPIHGDERRADGQITRCAGLRKRWRRSGGQKGERKDGYDESPSGGPAQVRYDRWHLQIILALARS
jgi:hypothetical protein